MGLLDKLRGRSKVPPRLNLDGPIAVVPGPQYTGAQLLDMGFPGIAGYSEKQKRYVKNPGTVDMGEDWIWPSDLGKSKGKKKHRHHAIEEIDPEEDWEDDGRYSAQARHDRPSKQRSHSRSKHHSHRGSRHSTDVDHPFDQPHPMPSHHSAGGFNPFDQDQPFSDHPFAHNMSSSPFTNPPHNFGAPTAPQFRSNHPPSSLPRGYASLPTPRPGKVREGDPLPTGIFDPLATSATAVPKGHHGLREHRQGMTNMHVGRGTSADNPAAKWDMMSELMRTERNGGSKRKGGSRYTHTAR